MGENLAISITIYSGLGALIAIGVVYNAARIQLSERAHELASLRSSGSRRGEVSFVLLGEQSALAPLAIPSAPARLRLRRLDRLGILDRYQYHPAGRSRRADIRPCGARRRGAALASALLVRRRIEPARHGGRNEDEGVRRWEFPARASSRLGLAALVREGNPRGRDRGPRGCAGGSGMPSSHSLVFITATRSSRSIRRRTTRAETIAAPATTRAA